MLCARMAFSFPYTMAFRVADCAFAAALLARLTSDLAAEK
jgi:hypothetical protein